MFRLVGGDMRDSREYVCTMSGGSFDAVSVINASFACLVIDVKVLKVVVKVNAPGAEIATEKGRVGSKDCRDINVPFATQRNGESCLPFVEMGDHSRVELQRNILRHGKHRT
jgi:hypothetical protein